MIEFKETCPDLVSTRFSISDSENSNEIGFCEVSDSHLSYEWYSPNTKPYSRKNNKWIYIRELYIEPEFRSKYYGTKLLYYIFRHYYKKGFKYVTLIDGSSRSCKYNSIYKKIGLTYIKETGCMCGNLRNILFGKFKGLNGKNTNNYVFYRNILIK